jgi:hypothetical protein
MNLQQRIAAIQSALMAINTSIVQTQAALSVATTVQEMARLQATLVQLQAQRSQLQSMLNSLTAAAAPGSMALPTADTSATAAVAAPKPTPSTSRRMVDAAARRLRELTAAREVVQATIAHGEAVREQVEALTSALAGGAERPPRKRSRAKRARG